MDISNIIDITVSLESAGVSKPGFGTPGIYGYCPTLIPPSTPVVEFSSATWSSDLVALGFTVSHPVYLGAKALCSQSPKPSKFKIIRGEFRIRRFIYVYHSPFLFYFGLNLYRHNNLILLKNTPR